MSALPRAEFVGFPSRRARSEFVARRFARYFSTNLLDVGCFEAPLRTILADIDYTGVDFVGNPDIELNLEQADRLPFEDSQFQAVICIDVLEHLDTLHAMFDELARVSGRYVIVSLPNCWRDARIKLERGRGGFAHYGLPVERPDDRHKWFFNAEEAMTFLRARAARNGLKVVELFTTEKPRSAMLRGVRHLRYPGIRYLNRYANTVWAVFEKDQSTAPGNSRS